MKRQYFGRGLVLACLTLFITCNADKSISLNHDIEAAIKSAQGKPIMVDFMAEWCPPCQKMEKTTFSKPVIINKTQKFIPVRIDVDKQKEIAIKYNGNASKYGGVGIPNILFLNSKGEKIRHIIGYHDADQLAAVMDSVLTGKYKNTKID